VRIVPYHLKLNPSGSILVTGILGLLLVILSLAVTKFELQAGSKDGHSISIKEHDGRDNLPD